jgi:hypothetical protein
MSDLAPFVAASIRDKVVADLKEENDKLRDQLRQRWAVEVGGDATKTEGSPRTLYATGQFDQGKSDRQFWTVSLSEAASCPLSALQNAELHVGGILKAVFGNTPDVEAFFDNHWDDNDNAHSIKFFFCGGGKLWIRIVVNGWPREHWEEVAADRDFNNEAMTHYLSRVLAAEYPNATVTFREAYFTSSSSYGAIQNLVLSETAQQEAEGSKEFRKVYKAVMTEMRAAGYEENSFVFGAEVQEVMDGMSKLGIALDYDTDADNIIDQIIEVHRRTRKKPEPAEAFLDVIRKVADSMEEDD